MKLSSHDIRFYASLIIMAGLAAGLALCSRGRAAADQPQQTGPEAASGASLGSDQPVSSR